MLKLYKILCKKLFNDADCYVFDDHENFIPDDIYSRGKINGTAGTAVRRSFFRGALESLHLRSGMWKFRVNF